VLDLILIGIIVGKKINILFKFLNVNKLAVNSFGPWMVGRLAVQRTVLARLAAKSTAQPGYGLADKA